MHITSVIFIGLTFIKIGLINIQLKNVYIIRVVMMEGGGVVMMETKLNMWLVQKGT